MRAVPSWVWIGLALVGLCLAAFTVEPAMAGPAAAPAQQATPGASPVTPPAPTTTPIPGSTPAPTTTPTTPGPLPIVQNIFHVIRFPFETMMDAVVHMSNKILLHSYREAGERFTGALDVLVTGPYGLAPDVAAGSPTPLFENLVLPHWRVTLTAALLLLPVTLLLSAVSALKLGATSALGLADLKEALLGWLISAGAAGSSYYLLSLAHRLTVATAGSLLAADFGTQVSGATLAGAFFNVNSLMALASNLLTSPIVLYLAFFGLFLASTVMLGLGLALAAYTALVYLLTALAPVVLVLGTLPPLRWLQALWLKAVVITFLLPIVDALLLKGAVSLFYNLLSAQGTGDSGTFIAGVFVTAGVVSVLIAINFKVAEAVFGALAEVHRQAFDATMGVVKLAAMAVGFAAGGVALGAGAGVAAGAGGGSASGAALAGGGAPLAGGPSGVGAAVTAAGPATGAQGTTGSSLAASAQAATNRGVGSVGIAQRMAQLLGASPPASPGAAGGMASAAGGGASDIADSGSPPAADAASIGGSGGGNAVEATASSAAPNNNQLRRARLAGSFGRALAHSTGNPVLKGLGLGLQASEMAAEARSGGPGSGDSPGGSTQATAAGALRWSNRDLSNFPNELFDPGRDNTELMAGGLHQGFLNTGRAMRMPDMLRLANQSYGAWHRQGQPGGLPAQRDLFEAMLDPNTKSSPESFVGRLESLATQHGFQLAGQIAGTAREAFVRSQDTGLGELPPPTTIRRT